MDKYLFLIPLLPLIGAILNGFVALFCAARKKPDPYLVPSIIGCLLPLISFVLTARAFFTLKSFHGESAIIESRNLFTWMSGSFFQVNFAFMLDPLSVVMTLVVTGVGSLIHIYSIGYMKGDPGYARYFSYLNLFLFFMLLLVMGNNLLVLFVGWEGVGLCSYLLIGFWFDDAQKASAGKKAFVVNRIGDFGFLIGLFLIAYAFSTQGQTGSIFDYSFLQANTEALKGNFFQNPLIAWATLCFFIGACGKSAQIPLYVWLPDAMAGPTPVSALIHAATMVTAGIYMVARLFFLYSLSPFVLHLIAAIGLATALLAALMALTQTDIKKVLAYSTVSQLGYMFLALGVGAPQSAIFHLVTHAFFKACLFLCAGSVIHALHHEQDIRKMGGLFKQIPITGVAFLVSTLAIAGIPPFSGFFSKDEILWHTYLNAPFIFYFIGLVTALLTAFYMTRLFVYVFLGTPRHHGVHHLSSVMNVPVAILGVLALVGGFLGVPEVLGGDNHFHHWLESLSIPSPVLGDYHSLELSLMGLSGGLVLMMILITYFLYQKNLNWTEGFKIKLRSLYLLINNKFYVDEIYQALIIRPIYLVSQWLLFKGMDQKIVDGVLVHGWSDVASMGSRLVSRLQSGFLGHYLVYLWLGLIGLLVFIIK